jgi:hypothetical protein
MPVRLVSSTTLPAQHPAQHSTSTAQHNNKACLFKQGTLFFEGELIAS